MVEETHNRSVIDSVLDIWKRRKWLMIMAFLAVFVLAVSLITALPSLYHSSTTVLFGQEDISESLVTSTPRNQVGQRLAVVQQEVLSRSHLLEVIEQFGLYPELRAEQVPDQALANRMRKDITIEQQNTSDNGREGTVSLTIGYQTWDPELAARVATELAARYERENEQLRMRSASRTTAFLEEQLEQIRARMVETEARINQFKTEHLGGLPQQVNSNLSALDRLNGELRLNGEKQLQLLTRLDDILTGDSVGDDGAGSGRDDLESLKRQLESLRTRYTDSFPGIIRLQNRIAELEANPKAQEGEKGLHYLRIANNPASIERELNKLSSEEAELQSRIEELQSRIEFTPKVEQELQQLTSEYASVREEYLEFEDRYQDARLAESLAAQQGLQFQILEAAVPPFMASQPQGMRLILMSFVMALGFAGGVALLSEQMDKTFHSVRDLRAFTSVPVLGTIAKIKSPAVTWRSRLRFLLTLVIFLAVIAIFAVLLHSYGENAKQVVWMMAR